MGHPRRSMESDSAKSNVNSRGPAQEASKGNNISNWDRDHSCEILAKNVAAFFPLSNQSA